MALITRIRLADWINKQYQTIFCIKETHSVQKEIHILKAKRWKPISYVTETHKKAGVSIVVADK